jgi:hypothetical protein
VVVSDLTASDYHEYFSLYADEDFAHSYEMRPSKGVKCTKHCTCSPMVRGVELLAVQPPHTTLYFNTNGVSKIKWIHPHKS